MAKKKEKDTRPCTRKALGLMPKLVNEFIGTFFLVLVVCLSSQGKVDCIKLASSLAIGSMLMVVVFMGGHISGGHYNPAVSIGVFCAGRACQLPIFAHTIEIKRGEDITIGGALFVEFLFTFILVTVVLNVATTNALEENSFYGTAIGFTVISGAICVGQISGGVFNPAIAFGPSMIHSASSGSRMNDTWLYYVGCVLGAITAAILFRLTNWGKEYGKRFNEEMGLDEDGNDIDESDDKSKNQTRTNSKGSDSDNSNKKKKNDDKNKDNRKNDARSSDNNHNFSRNEEHVINIQLLDQDGNTKRVLRT